MEDTVELILGLTCTALPLFIFFLIGRFNERSHFKSLDRREKALAHVQVTDMRPYAPGVVPNPVPEMVIGEVCIATDYWKSFLAKIRKIFGGRLGSYITLVERARREAMLRLLQEADRKGFNAVCNVRLETADIGGGATNTKGAVMIVMLVSGTAYRVAGTETP